MVNSNFALKEHLIFVSEDKPTERFSTADKGQIELDLLAKKFKHAVDNAKTVVFKKSEAIVIQ